MHIEKKWIYKSPDPALMAEIALQMGISNAAAAVLVNRGVRSLKDAELFLDPPLDDVANPFLLPDMEQAVTRIVRAIEGKEKILVYGDRDVDGVTSISIMVRALKSLGADTRWYIPSDEGYGVHNEIIGRYAKEGVTLIITVDCGISAVGETEFARGLGIDVVVTDHHEPPAGGIPRAIAVVDPKRADSRYPFSELAGCAVSYKVAQALMLSFGKYYDQDMVFVSLSAGGPETLPGFGAVKIRNEIMLETFARPIPSEDGREETRRDIEEFRLFLGNGRLVVFDTPALANLRDVALGFPQRPIIDVRDRAKKLFPLNDGSLAALACDMKIESRGATAVDNAAITAKIFYRLEKLADVRMDFFQKNNLDVITLGTIADIMPLIDENRIMVKQGLKILSDSRKVGVQMLLDRCVTKSKTLPLSAKTISWSITPILNSAGRRGRANLSAELLLTESEAQARELLDEILRLNGERKELQSKNLAKFLPLLRAQCDLENDKIFIVTAKGIEHGVTGIIASQIMRQYRRPTVLLIIEGNEAMGAARSVEGFDMVGALGSCRDILVKYGGHSQAAGLTASVDKLDEFRRRLREVAERDIAPEMLVPAVEIDAELEAQDATMQLLCELSEMEPYGMGNPYPVFSLKKMKVREHGRVGPNGDHLKLRVSGNGGAVLGAIGWGLGHMDDDIGRYPSVDMAVQLELNVWQDKETLQLLILDIKPNDNQ
jgi:single-stranded-DNA-specific exonuclease